MAPFFASRPTTREKHSTRRKATTIKSPPPPTARIHMSMSYLYVVALKGEDIRVVFRQPGCGQHMELLPVERSQAGGPLPCH